MRITDLFSSGHPFPSLEIVPPLSGITQRELLDSIRPLMDFQPRYINVTTHRDELQYTPLPDGSYKREVVRNRVSPVAVCACIQAHFPVEVVPHIICSGHTAREIEWQLQDFHFMGIDNVMALRGDSLAGEKRFTPEPDGYAHASELVRAIREQAGFCVGVGAYPEKHFEAANLETDIEYLKAKVDAGADYVITQMFFDNAVFFRFVEKCRAAGITVPIIPGLKPLTTPRPSARPETRPKRSAAWGLNGALHNAGTCWHTRSPPSIFTPWGNPKTSRMYSVLRFKTYFNLTYSRSRV